MPEAMEDLVAMKRLWVHEVLRVYYDRLVDDSDRTWIVGALREVCKDKLEEDMNTMFQRLAPPNGSEVSSNQDPHWAIKWLKNLQIGETELRKLIYCDFANPKADHRDYIEVQDLEQLKSITEGYLNEFNNMSKKPMNLVLFRYVHSFYVLPNYSLGIL